VRGGWCGVGRHGGGWHGVGRSGAAEASRRSGGAVTAWRRRCGAAEASARWRAPRPCGADEAEGAHGDEAEEVGARRPSKGPQNKEEREEV
jgi:hypothetical protein